MLDPSSTGLQSGFVEGVLAVPLNRDVLTPQEVAEYLQLAPDTVYRYIREGKLVASKLGRQYRIPKENVELFLLVTSTAGGARMRTFSRQEAVEWLAEDQIDEETRSTGDRLLANLPNKSL
jgi:excisionase family DNA binding protein